MIKQAKFTYVGANQDISKSKHLNTYYFDAEHIKILATSAQSSTAVTNEKGTELVISIPNITISTAANTITYDGTVLPYKNGGGIDIQRAAGTLPASSTTQQIIGATSTRTGIIVFTTDGLGMDCVWHIDNVIDGSYTLELMYLRNLNFSLDYPIQALFNYENENLQKVYWVDGKEQIRFINIKHNLIEGNSEIIDIPATSIDFVGTVDFSQPLVTSIGGGGTHTAGMIQYAYNLYRLNSSQTKISPLSELVPLGNGGIKGGGELNEQVGATPVVRISDIDQAYTHIKIYAIKYTSLNEIPSINLIDERELDSDTVTIFDDGGTISNLSLEEFLFLGSDPYIPQHIEAKDNRLILANIKTNDFILDEELDFRAYSFLSTGVSRVYDNLVPLTGNAVNGTKYTINTTTWALDKNNDAVNLNYDTLRYQQDGITEGGEGKYLKYTLLKRTAGQLSEDVEDLLFFKDNEMYRIGIVLYNRLGQESLPQWIADFKAPEGNLEGNYNTLKVEFKPAFTTWLNNYSGDESNRPVGYKIIRAERTINDRTIITQGIINGMMCNVARDSGDATIFTPTERRINSDTSPKLPNFLMRTFEQIQPLQPNSHLLNMQFRDGDPNDVLGGTTTEPGTEIQFDEKIVRAADTFQYTTMMQLYSPEITFSDINFSQDLLIRIKGGAINNNNFGWSQIRNVNTKVAEREGKVTGGLHLSYGPGVVTELIGNDKNMMERGLIHNANARDEESVTDFLQWYRDFTGYKKASNSNIISTIYGAPEITERGQGRTVYNKNPKYEYSNTLEGFATDGEASYKPDQYGLISLNSYGEKCATIVLGSANDIPSYSRPSLEDLYATSGIAQTNTALIIEIQKPNIDKYTGNIYGGVSYEDKKRTNYIQIGSYNDIDVTSVQIDSPGDTFVQQFNFLRIAKTNTEIYQYNINQMTELVSVVVETTIDLKNRNDISNSAWDAAFQPQSVDYHQYNTVYSQQPTLVQSTDVDSTFRRIENFDTRLQATKLKTPNESIDNWTDILVNETMDLNGKYGPINNIIEFKDNLYAFQDEAIAAISINPRVQVQGSDGIGIELGTGAILNRFNYITTKSGSLNKWGMVSTKKGIYYYDALNKGVGRFPDAVTPLLSDVKGLHSFFNNNYDYASIVQDNPVQSAGAVLGYDNYNNDVYITLLQGDKSFTWCFNEFQDQFVDRKLYLPSKYIYKGEKLISLSADNTLGYEHYAGDYNNYHGVATPSTITLQLNPDSDVDSIFHNIFFNSELYLSDIDQPDKTLTHITAYNEYQDSGRIPLIVGRSSNLRRKFREWKADIPRTGRNRVRNPWIYLKLELDNTSNYRLILHDIIVSYTI